MNEDLTPASTTVPRHQRRFFVVLMILFAVVMFLMMAGLLFFRWSRAVEPSSVMIVEGSQKLRGAEVTVDGLGLLKAHHAVFGVGERFFVPFYLEPGSYTVRVTLNGRTLAETETVVLRNRMVNLNFTSLDPGTDAATTTASPP